MRTGHLAMRIAGGLAVVATVAAAAMIWWLLTDPVHAVNVLQTGDLGLVLRQLVQAVLTGAHVAMAWL